MNEQQRVDQASAWYLSEQLDLDVRMIQFRYRSIQPHFVGKRGCELGPAEGQMTKLMLDDFDHLTIVDAAEVLLNEIPENVRLTKVHSLFENYDPAEKFNTIILEHILEHVEDPVELLQRSAGWLDGEGPGRLIAGVPNADSFHRLAAVKMGLLQTPTELNPRDHELGHRRVYTLEHLFEHVESAGLKIVASGGVFMKPLSNSQIQNHWTDEMIDAFFELGKDFQEHAAEIFVVAEPK